MTTLDELYADCRALNRAVTAPPTTGRPTSLPPVKRHHVWALYALLPLRRRHRRRPRRPRRRRSAPTALADFGDRFFARPRRGPLRRPVLAGGRPHGRGPSASTRSASAGSCARWRWTSPSPLRHLGRPARLHGRLGRGDRRDDAADPRAARRRPRSATPATSASPSSSRTSSATSPRTSTAAASTCRRRTSAASAPTRGARRSTTPWRDADALRDRPLPRAVPSRPTWASRMLPPASARCIRAARVLYSGILDRIEAAGYDVFADRARVPTWRKVLTVACGRCVRLSAMWCRSLLAGRRGSAGRRRCILLRRRAHAARRPRRVRAARVCTVVVPARDEAAQPARACSPRWPAGRRAPTEVHRRRRRLDRRHRGGGRRARWPTVVDPAHRRPAGSASRGPAAAAPAATGTTGSCSSTPTSGSRPPGSPPCSPHTSTRRPALGAAPPPAGPADEQLSAVCNVCAVAGAGGGGARRRARRLRAVPRVDRADYERSAGTPRSPVGGRGRRPGPRWRAARPRRCRRSAAATPSRSACTPTAGGALSRAGPRTSPSAPARAPAWAVAATAAWVAADRGDRGRRCWSASPRWPAGERRRGLRPALRRRRCPRPLGVPPGRPVPLGDRRLYPVPLALFLAVFVHSSLTRSPVGRSLAWPPGGPHRRRRRGARPMIPLVNLPTVALVVVDVVAWAAFHSVTGYAVHRAPPRGSTTTPGSPGRGVGARRADLRAARHPPWKACPRPGAVRRRYPSGTSTGRRRE